MAFYYDEKLIEKVREIPELIAHPVLMEKAERDARWLQIANYFGLRVITIKKRWNSLLLNCQVRVKDHVEQKGHVTWQDVFTFVTQSDFRAMLFTVRYMRFLRERLGPLALNIEPEFELPDEFAVNEDQRGIQEQQFAELREQNEDLKKQNEDLKKQNEDLKEQNVKLLARIEQLEKQVAQLIKNR